jgi:peptide/nickel transport system ATP-binding protein
MPLVSIQNLTVSLPPGADRPLAVEDVGLEIGRKEIVCIVGESGSGKSMTAHAIMGLLPRGVAATGGTIVFDGVNLLKQPPEAMRRRRGRDIAMIFQDPMAALNPVVSIGRQVSEQIRAHRPVSESEALKQTAASFREMGLQDVALGAYPHQLSGGQRQRVMIAMALSLSPKLLIADEPTTALDVTTQAQILKLIKRIQAEREMSVLLITHDFGIVADMADSVAVMRDGRIVESGATRQVLGNPSNGYTCALIAAVPKGSLFAPSRCPPGAGAGLTKRFRRGGLFSARQRSRRGHVRSPCRGDIGVVGESGGQSTGALCVIRCSIRTQASVAGCADIAHMKRAIAALRRRIRWCSGSFRPSIRARRLGISSSWAAGHGEDRPSAPARRRHAPGWGWVEAWTVAA